MKEVIENAIIIISLIVRNINIVLVNPPNVRIITALISRKRASEVIITAMMSIVLLLLRANVNDPIAVYNMKLNTPTINIPIKNANPASRPPIAPAIASPIFSAVISIEKLRATAKASGSRNTKAKIVRLLKRSNTPITILNGLINSIVNIH
jgi:hypothetical protein